ncbi:MAG: hypothetical protein ABEN55_01740, partial [Bradymonadaceae bacterium]
MKHAILPIVALTALAVLLAGMPEAKATSCASPSRFPACINAGTGFDRGDSVAAVDIEHTGPKCADFEVFYTSPNSGEQKVGPQKKSFRNGWCHLEAILLYNNCESAIEFRQPLFFADADPGRDRAVGPG